MSAKKTRIRQWIRSRADNPRQNFGLLVMGFALFTLGLLLVGAAQYGLTNGLVAELLALAGLLLLGSGIILAAVGYISLSVLRIIRFLDDDSDE
ncbi:MAG: hypothetical protein CMI01_16685 [Oceanospirillaceae bacterium]|uniref:hypothetical protein n=1 Tax=Marinobacterium litorale TaxID=404770 RepID=UPI00047F591F|nr:hypothetical protein [Marinobacterium litorale]MBT00290.1 hypothetical protein [Oceanospirillaceae bacterium]